MSDNLDPRRVIHANLLQRISDNFDTNSAEYENFLHQMGTLFSSVIGKWLIKQKKTLYAKFDALENQGLLGIDKYDFLKIIARNSGNIWILEHIETAEGALKEQEKKKEKRIQEEKQPEHAHIGDSSRFTTEYLVFPELQAATKYINDTTLGLEDTFLWDWPMPCRKPRCLDLNEAFEGMDRDAAYSKWLDPFSPRHFTDDENIITPMVKRFNAAVQQTCEEAKTMVQGGLKGAQLFANVKDVARFTADLLVAGRVKAAPGSDDIQQLEDAANAVMRAIEGLVHNALLARSYQRDRSSSSNACSVTRRNTVDHRSRPYPTAVM